jgi:two-component system chemotaxis response regulator CheB
MPLNASRIAGADHVVSAPDLAPLLIELVREPESVSPQRRVTPMDPIEKMPEVVDQDMDRQARNERRGRVSTYTCPECGGSLWQVDEAGLIRFRCHVGHAYGGEALLAEQTEALEAALWTAVRTFREKSVLARQLAHRERASGDPAVADRFEEQSGQAARFGELIQSLLLNDGTRDRHGEP